MEEGSKVRKTGTATLGPGSRWQKSKKRRNNKYIVLFTLQARQWVQMWHSHLGDAATPAAIIEAIQECGGGEEILINIKKACN